jgi:macrolide-specific efflux system membrane fusion protein
MFMKWWTEYSFKPGDVGGTGGKAFLPGRRMLLKGAAAAAVCAALLVSSGCGLLPKESQEEVLPTITPPKISQKPEYEVTTTTLETKVQANGKLLATQEETLYFTLDGKRLQSLTIKSGQQVKAGQVIGQLDVDQMQKDLRKQKLNLRKSEIDMKDKLRKRDETDPVEFEGWVIAFEEERQAITDAEADIAKGTLTAPFSGTVVTVNVEKGAQIKAYDPICVIANTSQLVVAASMIKDDLDRVTVGMPATVNINGAGDFEGKVKALPMVTDDAQNGGGNGNGGQQPKPDKPENYLLVDIGKLPAGLNRGTPLSVEVILQRKENAIVIPLATLRTIGSRTYVQVVDEKGKREVDVAVGQQTSTQAEIVEGLTPGQKVVGP